MSTRNTRFAWHAENVDPSIQQKKQYAEEQKQLVVQHKQKLANTCWNKLHAPTISTVSPVSPISTISTVSPVSPISTVSPVSTITTVHETVHENVFEIISFEDANELIEKRNTIIASIKNYNEAKSIEMFGTYVYRNPNENFIDYVGRFEKNKKEVENAKKIVEDFEKIFKSPETIPSSDRPQIVEVKFGSQFNRFISNTEPKAKERVLFVKHHCYGIDARGQQYQNDMILKFVNPPFSFDKLGISSFCSTSWIFNVTDNGGYDYMGCVGSSIGNSLFENVSRFMNHHVMNDDSKFSEIALFPMIPSKEFVVYGRYHGTG